MLNYKFEYIFLEFYEINYNATDGFVMSISLENRRMG